jgi:hypothetical protein
LLNAQPFNFLFFFWISKFYSYILKKCYICGIPLSNIDDPGLEDVRVPIACDRCFLIEIKKNYPLVKFLDAHGKEPDDVDKCVILQGIKLKNMPKNA